MILLDIASNCGMGNQMFIYGMAYAIAKRENQKIFLIISKKDVPERPYCLHLFAIDRERIAGTLILSSIQNAKVRTWLPRQIRRITKYILHGCVHTEEKEESRIFVETPAGKSAYYLRGFFESYYYVQSVLPELRAQYQPTFPIADKTRNLWDTIQADHHAVALHIRMGDFVQLKRSYPLSYYENAMEYHRCRDSEAHFYLLSEDQPVVQHFAHYRDVTVIDLSGENHRDIAEWYCLVQCKHHILSSSTYSWWAAVLAETEESVITIPTLELYHCYDNKEGNSDLRYHNFYKSDWIPIPDTISYVTK